MKDEFEYYDKKIEELNQLLHTAKSSTLQELINKSVTLTEKSLETLTQTQAASVKYISEHNNNTSQKVLNYKEQYELLVQRKKILDTIPNETLEKVSLVEQFHIDIDVFQKKADFEAQFNELVLDTFSKCQAEIERTLLEFIVKPSNTEFRYEQVMDIINLLLSKLQIPGFDEVNTLSKFSVKSKKKEHINSGDKIILYIEQYNDVLERWDVLCKNYIAIVEA
ncbi:MAG: hypothetical protein IT271_05560 [Chitinophagales bacterium]|nr:hypothetical protein [Chitinophagales bacterium]